MTTTTSPLGLTLYSGSSPDTLETFLSYRLSVNGDSGSGFIIINDAIVADRLRLTALEALKFITPISATYDGSGSNYSATGVTEITSYINGAIIALNINITNAGVITLNINSLGIRSLMKINSAGTAVNLDANDLILNRTYLFKYNLGSTRWEWVSATSGSNLNVPGTVGNLATVTTNGALLGTLDQSTMISQTTHSATSKTAGAPLLDTDEVPLVDTASGNSLKKLTIGNLKTFITTSLGAMIVSATAKTPVAADIFGYADASDSSTKKTTITTFFSIFGTLIANLSAKTTAAIGDRVLLSDASGNTTVKMALSDLMGVINVLTDKPSPVSADLLSIYDSVASAAKKLTLANLIVFLRSFLSINAPEGFLQNGKIVPSVSSNNLTVAIKTLAGTDPSATDPVYIRINGVIRSITAALSVTKNAGTNWFASGSTMLATNEIDYFVYLGYNTGTSAVVIGFARTGGASQYSDFSATTTAEKYCAISDITTIANTDYFSVVGRFSATLSATASFNWSVPTFTAINLLNYPIRETRWLVYAPVITAASGTFTSVSAVGRYQISYKKVFTDVLVTITTNGTASLATDIPLPIACHALNEGAYTGREMTSNGSLCVVWLSSTTALRLQKYDGSYIGANGYVLGTFVTYEMG